MSNLVDSYKANDIQYLTVGGTGGLKAAFKGRGVLSSRIRRDVEHWGVGMTCQFLLEHATQTEGSTYSSGRTSVAVDAESSFPCSGFTASSGEGYIVSPAVKLVPIRGQNIILMFFSPRTKPFNVSLEKAVLSFPGEATEVTVIGEGGGIRCAGMISSKAKQARFILNRNPRLPFNKTGFDETLSHIEGEGQITANWKPVARTFDELLVAFYSSRVLSDDIYSWGLDRITSKLGSPDLAETGPLDYVIGDGIGVNYTLRLTVDRGLGRHETDETRVTVA